MTTETNNGWMATAVVTGGAFITTFLLVATTLAAYFGKININWIWPGIGLVVWLLIAGVIVALAMSDLFTLPPSRSGQAE